MRYILEDQGFDTSDIIQTRGDNIICNYNAINCPSLRDTPESESASIFRQPYESDYSMRDNTPEKYIEVLTGRYELKEA